MRVHALTVLFFFFTLAAVSQEQKDLFLETAYGVDMELIFVEGGSFEMGSPEEDPYHQYFHQRFNSCRERLTKKNVSDFYIAKFELTYDQYMKITDAYVDQHIPYRLMDTVAGQPAGYLSWWDAVRFCNRLSDLAGYKPYYIDDGDGGLLIDNSTKGYRLPTEAEWEYAAKGGVHNKPDKAYDIDAMSWYKNTGGKVSVVGQKAPNALGLYDMTGNVWEWVQDQFGPGGYYYGAYYMVKGGCYQSDAAFCRPAAKTGFLPKLRDMPLGVRVVKHIPIQ
ncbi:formylglycine-generating enzyme family protein [Aquimarina brevivitae]|uniref:Formylglycine-generating enzyme required for sulfatase activity n=1 Tax=Aquimarina brevivitae TaxID=323412 RepID=A0A4Q7NUV1_9FLAO|nr:SUMF1/EgtB/PvdO family nonheme iron enzyme [Aquimarina brevivitae]RZS90628.1 formylglycine-generating enzyme required for sulfatase activity [Aquimarina brevivitae]